MPLSKRREVAQFVHRKLLFRLRRLAIFFLVIVGIIIYEMTMYNVSPLFLVAGFFLGVAIGIVINHKMHNISWDAETSKTVTRMDRLGVYILIGYLIFAITRRYIFSYWLHGYNLTVFTLSVAAGSMLGRLFSTRQKIRQILKREGFLHFKNPDSKDE